MFNAVNQLSEAKKGIIMIIGGGMLLLNTMGILPTSINLLMSVGAIALIIYGFLKAGYKKKLVELLQSTHKK